MTNTWIKLQSNADLEKTNMHTE